VARRTDQGDVQGAEFGKYRVVRKLGAGSHGVVYEAGMSGPMGFSKRVAVKVLRSQLIRADQDFVHSMVNEARIGGLLHHPNVVNVLEFGQVEDRYYITTEFVDGATLGEIIALCRREGSSLPPSVILGLGEQVCRGLHYAHLLKDADGRPLRVIHRDVKPSNILVDRHGVARIMDFGIAKAASNLFHTTAAEVIRGTPQYIAPEQLLGEKPLLPGCDIFSLGAVLYEMVTLQPLFSRPRLEDLFAAILEGDLAEQLGEAEEKLPGVRPVLARALARDPASRYQYARSFGADLKRLAQCHANVPEVEDYVGGLLPRIGERGLESIHDGDALQRDFAQETDRYQVAYRQAISMTDGRQPSRPDALSVVAAARTEDDAPPKRRKGLWIALGVLGMACILASALILTSALVGYGVFALDGAGAGGGWPLVGLTGAEEETAPEVPDTPPDLRVEGGPATPIEPMTDPHAVAEPPTPAPDPPTAPTHVAASDGGSVPPDAPSFISANARPWATVYLDGRMVGTTPMQDLEIAAGTHTVRLECGPCPSPSAQEYTFDVAAGESYSPPFTEFSD